MKKTYPVLILVVLTGLFFAPRTLLAKAALFDDNVFKDADHLPLEEDY